MHRPHSDSTQSTSNGEGNQWGQRWLVEKNSSGQKDLGEKVGPFPTFPKRFGLKMTPVYAIEKNRSWASQDEVWCMIPETMKSLMVSFLSEVYESHVVCFYVYSQALAQASGGL